MDFQTACLLPLIPAQAGIQDKNWVPACAGTSGWFSQRSACPVLGGAGHAVSLFFLPLKHEGSGAPGRRFGFFEPWPCGHGAPLHLEEARAFRRSAAVSVTASVPRSPGYGPHSWACRLLAPSARLLVGGGRGPAPPERRLCESLPAGTAPCSARLTPHDSAPSRARHRN